MMNIWEERQVMPSSFLKTTLAAAEASKAARKTPERSPSVDTEPRTTEFDDAYSPTDTSPLASASPQLRPQSQLSDFLVGVEIPEPTESNELALINLLTELKSIRERTKGKHFANLN